MNNIKLKKILVGGGTCGNAAGASELVSYLASSEWKDLVVHTGCQGMCHLEPHMQIIDQNDRVHTFAKVALNQIESMISSTLISPVSNQQLIEENLFLKQQKRIALRNIGNIDPMNISDYLANGGYQAIKKIFDQKMAASLVIDEVKKSGLRGRGGAGFPTHMKWQIASEQNDSKKYLICNGDEGDPGAFMDRSLLEGDPHSVIEGMLIAGYAIGASFGYAYIRAEYPLAVSNFQKAVDDAYAKGYLGKNIFGSSFSFDLKIKEGAGAFVCGEEIALISSIEGERGVPRKRPPFPAISGLFGHPTIINNVETLANIPWIIVNGGEQYASYGTNSSKGTKVFALAGAIKNGGLVEVPMGTSIHDVLYKIGGGSKSSHALKAVQLGGPSGGCIPASLFNTIIDYDEIGKTGAIMGSGGMIVLDETNCMVDVAKFFLDFTQRESCGKCTFCRIGTLRLKELLEKISRGEAVIEDLKTLEDLSLQVKNTSLCGLGQTAPNPVLTGLRYFYEEFKAHIVDKKCPAKVCKKLITHQIINDTCKACSLCKKQCPVGAIEGVPKHPESFIIDPKVCINCGICKDVCPFNSIKVE